MIKKSLSENHYKLVISDLLQLNRQIKRQIAIHKSSFFVHSLKRPKSSSNRIWTAFLVSIFFTHTILPSVSAQDQSSEVGSVSVEGPKQNLQNWVDLALEQSESLKAVDISIQSLDSEIKARDLVLSGQFILQAENFNNDQDAVTFARRTRSRFVDLIYQKPFSTGTLLSLTSGHDRSRIDGFGIRNTADWEVRLTQSLWRDAFGRATRFRHQGEQSELLARKANLTLEKQQLIIQLESLYWDLSLALKEEQVRIDNLKISKNLKSWTIDRLAKTAAERSDVLQAQALLSSRELDLISVQNQIETIKNNLRILIPMDLTQLPLPVLDELEQLRPLENLMVAKGTLETPERLDTVASFHLAEQAAIQTQQVRESLKPDLNAYLSYGQNGISESFDEAWNRAGNDRYSGVRVGVQLTLPLDFTLIKEQEKAAALSAKAQDLRTSALTRNVQISWKDLNRRLEVLINQVKESNSLYQFQKSKVEEERRRYKIGRSTVFQLVTFEVEAAEAEIRRYRFLAELRKLEGQARLFTGTKDFL